VAASRAGITRIAFTSSVTAIVVAAVAARHRGVR
jgi:uncharacterized membrane protein YtjA (UPF0391 family)